MILFRRLGRVSALTSVGGLVAGATFVIGSPVANACISPSTQRLEAANTSTVCCTSVLFDITSSSSTRVPFKSVPTFKDGPGGTMSVTKSYSGTAGYSITAGGSVEVGGVLAKAKVEVSGSLEQSNSTTATNNYSQKITKGKYGNAQYVSYGKNVHYKREQYHTDCSHSDSTGAITFPSTSEGWYYWETSS